MRIEFEAINDEAQDPMQDILGPFESGQDAQAAAIAKGWAVFSVWKADNKLEAIERLHWLSR